MRVVKAKRIQKHRKLRKPLRKQSLSTCCNILSEETAIPPLFLDFNEEETEVEVEELVEEEVEAETEANDDAEAITELTDLIQELIRLGLQSHLLNNEQKSLSYTKTLLGRIARCLDWTYRFHHEKQLIVSKLEPWLRKLIQQEYILLTAYVNYIVDFKFYFPATVLSHMDDIKAATTWYVLFKVGNLCTMSDLHGISQTISTIRRLQSKKVRLSHHSLLQLH